MAARERDEQMDALRRELEQLRISTAATEAARVAAVTRAEAAEALVAGGALRRGAASFTAAPAAPAAPSVPALPSPLRSPTKGGAEALLADTGFWGIVPAPLSFDAGSVPASFAPVLEVAREFGSRNAGLAAALTSKKAYHVLAVSALPDHVTVGAQRVCARTLFGDAALRTPRWVFDGDCFPELGTAPRDRAALRPAFQGELKSVHPTMLGQALYYAMMDITGVFFARAPGAAVGAPGPRVFYPAPPRCFVLLSFPHVGYFIAVEMAGKALISPASRPFFLGSDEHRAAVEALPSAPAAPPVWLFDAELPWCSDATTPAEEAAAASASTSASAASASAAAAAVAVAVAAALPAPPVSWAVCPDGRFRKLVRADARSAEEWAEMCSAYAALAPLLFVGVRGSDPSSAGAGACLRQGSAAASAATFAGAGACAANTTAVLPPPSLARNVRLLFGAHEALVEMEAVAGTRTASDYEATGAGAGADVGASAGAGAGVGAGVAPDEAAASVLAAVAYAVAWLAENRVLYTDLRGPNVLVASALARAGGAPAAWLVDYDDCIVVPEPIRSVEALRAALGGVAQARAARRAVPAAPGFAPRFAAGEFPRLSAALDAAFARLRGERRSRAAPAPKA